MVKIHVEIPQWTSSENQLLYSALALEEQGKIQFSYQFNHDLHFQTILLHVNGNTCFLDNSDQTDLTARPEQYYRYFKRSLLPQDFAGNVHPLNLMVDFSYKPFKMLAKIGIGGILHLVRTKNYSEIIRILDVSGKYTNVSHHSMDLRRFPTQVADNGGKILYLSRLWDPARNPDPAEQERRRIQSETRIAICRTIKKHFPGSIVGLANEPYTKSIAPDLVLDASLTSKLAFMKALRSADICLADDGLGNTPGWKIGEYLMHGKAIITTPIRTVVQDFYKDKNYLELGKNNVETDLLSNIEQLLQNKQYMDMGEQNMQWSHKYLYPEAYMKRILRLIGEQV